MATSLPHSSISWSCGPPSNWFRQRRAEVAAREKTSIFSPCVGLSGDVCLWCCPDGGGCGGGGGGGGDGGGSGGGGGGCAMNAVWLERLRFV